MSKKLRISAELSLPPDAATSTLIVYGGKGMGKTNLLGVLAEEFASADIRFALLDPIGVSWGLRHGADGKGDGIKVLILGGIHGDLPIEPTAGAIVADLVVDEDVSVIIDISRRADGSMWSIAERVRFVTAFAKRMYQRQGEKRRPINLIVDEAARFAPQIVRHGESDVAACMGAIAVLVEEGRNVGIGVTLVTQRSARLNKDVAELADCVIAFRIVGPNSMRAVLDWLGEHVDKTRLKDIGEKLRSLPRGSALVVSPGWLEFEGIVAIRKRETFDSSATPKPGKEVRASGKGAAPDLSKYRERMAEVVERAKADDPKALRAELAEIKKQLAKAQQVIDSKITIAKADAKVIEKPVLKADQLNRLEAAVDALDNINANWIEQARDAAGELKLQLDRGMSAGEVAHAIAAELRAAMSPPRPTLPVGKEGRSHGAAGPVRSAATPPPAGRKSPATIPSEGVTGPQQRILNALAVLENIGASPADKTQLALFANASPTSSSYTNNCGALRTAGLIDYPGPSQVVLTEAGRARAQAEAAPSTVEEMHAFVRKLVSGPQWALLDVLIRAYPDGVPNAELAAQAGASVTSSSFTNNKGALRTLGLIDYPGPGMTRAEPVLFLETR